MSKQTLARAQQSSSTPKPLAGAPGRTGTHSGQSHSVMVAGSVCRRPALCTWQQDNQCCSPRSCDVFLPQCLLMLSPERGCGGSRASPWTEQAWWVEGENETSRCSCRVRKEPKPAARFSPTAVQGHLPQKSVTFLRKRLTFLRKRVTFLGKAQSSMPNMRCLCEAACLLDRERTRVHPCPPCPGLDVHLAFWKEFIRLRRSARCASLTPQVQTPPHQACVKSQVWCIHPLIPSDSG